MTEVLPQRFKSLSGERGLWRAALVRAWRDARGGDPNDVHVSAAERDEARAWFAEGGEDFRTACSFAGVEPDRFRRRALETLGVTVG